MTTRLRGVKAETRHEGRGMVKNGQGENFFTHDRRARRNPPSKPVTTCLPHPCEPRLHVSAYRATVHTVLPGQLRLTTPP